MPKTRRSSGTSKYGRNKVKCGRYRSEGRREKNKERRITRLFACIRKKNPDVKYRRIENNLVKVEK